MSANINTLSSNNTELENKVNNLAKSIESLLAQPQPLAQEPPAITIPSSIVIHVADELSEQNKM